MIIFEGEKLTPNQMAKEIILELGNSRSSYWSEFTVFSETAEKTTEREEEQIRKAIVKQKNRIAKFLGLDLHFTH